MKFDANKGLPIKTQYAWGDGDEEIHRVLTTKAFPRQADVLTTHEWVKG